MQLFRHLLAQRHLSVLICAATLLLKLLVPTGYMIDADHGRIAITICPGTVPAAMTMQMHGDTAGHGAEHGQSSDHGKAGMPCAFAGLSAAALGAADQIQLAALIAFVLSAGLAGRTLPPASARVYLRPPLRGPPARL
ncbi:MAG: hypothetical protein PGN16_00070 [Sphingomonas phyllosphaerae]|uniref:DUF2946 family protein n=1 Tax=Sphingomonas phyllosphaerae TaxID=257003 RepID=UPI002FFA085A